MAGTPKGGNPIKRGVTFGPNLSPELIDKNLPSNTPVKRGGHHDLSMAVDEDFGRVAAGEDVAARLRAAMEDEEDERSPALDEADEEDAMDEIIEGPVVGAPTVSPTVIKSTTVSPNGLVAAGRGARSCAPFPVAPQITAGMCIPFPQ
jgi:hypothetical protein